MNLLEQQILEILRQLSPNEQLQVQTFVEALISNRLPQVTNEPLTEEKITHKQKSRTIAQAILEVMQETNRPMSSQEICQLILERNLYHFNTNDPLKMVRDALWRHDMKTGKRSSPNKYFIQDGKYWIPSDDIMIPTQVKEETFIVDIDIEASFYDYLFELEDLDNNEL